MNESPLNTALRFFEAAEANLVKLDRLWEELESLIPSGVGFLDDSEYENICRDFETIFDALPKIDGWKPNICLMDLDTIAQMRWDAMEIGEIECKVATENHIYEPAKLLREYRYKFNRKRRELVRDTLQSVIDSIDEDMRILSVEMESNSEINEAITNPRFDDLKAHVAEIDTLIGSEPRPNGWSALNRHIHFGLVSDLQDILNHDWPSVKSGIIKSLYGEKDPIPVEVEDLGCLVSSKPSGTVATKLNWKKLSPEDFERIIFALISFEKGYENPEWITKTNAPDRGRDLSVLRIHNDSLGGTFRYRTIIQCKHWLSKSVSVSDFSKLKEQMKLWEPPKVDIHVIATTGRFSSDAVAAIERHNQSDSGLRIEMWADSHLERLLSSRPSLIAEFGLR